MGIFFAVMTVANVVIASQLSYRAVEQMDTVQFCGATCHVMKPEFTAHAAMPPHQAVACASCHIAPGATGWLKAKMAGTNQLFAVMFNTFPRPIESAMENNKLVSSAETCEAVPRSANKPISPRLRVIPSYKDDEANTRTSYGLADAHRDAFTRRIWGLAFSIRYAAADKKRQTIPWVEYTNRKPAPHDPTWPAARRPTSVRSLPTFDMQCVDCHNRASHAFELPERAVNQAMALGQIAPSLPFVKKESMELLKASYSSDDEAAQKIPGGLEHVLSAEIPGRRRQAGRCDSGGGDEPWQRFINAMCSRT